MRKSLWCVLALLLLAWNVVLGTLASPFVLLHRYDSVQYQLLARNRLHGHYEVGDRAHTVHEEGCHPMWRPGLVWIEDGLARCFGSVHNGAAVASAVGTTLLELALLCLAWRSFGYRTSLCVVTAFAAPVVTFPFMELAVGQGPEVWAAAAIVAGLALLVEGLRRRSMLWAFSAGAVAGMSEWFRTGNLLLFAIPCAVYGLADIRRKDWRQFWLPACAFVTWLGMAGLGDRTVPSPVNKTIANLWDCSATMNGPLLTEELADGSCMTSSLLIYTLVPGTTEITIDAVLRDSCGRSTLMFCREHGSEIGTAYVQRLQQVLKSGFHGLRLRTGELVLVLFGIALLLGLARPDPLTSHMVAIAGAALGQYLGPVVLISGDEPSHYVLVAYPLILLVAVRGALLLVELGTTAWNRWRAVPPIVLGIGPLLAALLSVPFLDGAMSRLLDLQRRAEQQQAAVDALSLEGLQVACRNMAWFVDRDVHTVFLPYATVPELENYVRAHAIDGILIWEDDGMAAFRANPYGSVNQFARALADSAVFAPPQVSGSWRWYPLAHYRHSKEQQ
jgi:hypothetical protein